MNADQFRKAAHAAIEDIISHSETVSSKPVVSLVQPGYLAPRLPSEPPQQPQDWNSIHNDIRELIEPGLTHWQHPGFMAFFPAHTSYPSILGEMYSAGYSAPGFNWLCSPAMTELETVMMDWVAQLIGLPECFFSKTEGGGVIQGSASEAIVTCMVAARERMLAKIASEYESEKEQEYAKDAVRGKLVALGSEHAHSSTQKGSYIVGTKVRTVPTSRNDAYAIRGPALRQVLEDCQKDGLVPYYITVTFGTTNTCAVDNFQEIAQVMRDWPDVWIHVDAAYAGSALSCPEYRHLISGVEHYDSFDFNMHKWMLTNFDLSCLFVQKRRDLTSALSVTPAYLRNAASDSGLVTDYRDWQIPLGRRFRALKVWFVLRSYGVEGVQAQIRDHIRLGEYFHSLVKTRDDLFDVVVPPAFALTVLTCKPLAAQGSSTNPQLENVTTSSGTSSAQILANKLTQAVYERVNASGEIFLTSSMFDGIYAIRVVSANANSEKKHLLRCFEILVGATEREQRNMREESVKEA